MSQKLYVLFKRIVTDNTYLPTFEVHRDPIEGKVAVIEPGECVDVYTCTLSRQGNFIWVDQYRVENIDGDPDVIPTESYCIERPK